MPLRRVQVEDSVRIQTEIYERNPQKAATAEVADTALTADVADDSLLLEGHPASYFAVAGSLAALSESSSAPPAASVTYLGQFFYYRPAATSGQLLFCQRDSAGGYEWTVVAQASL